MEYIFWDLVGLFLIKLCFNFLFLNEDGDFTTKLKKDDLGNDWDNRKIVGGIWYETPIIITTNQGSFSKQEREPLEREILCKETPSDRKRFGFFRGGGRCTQARDEVVGRPCGADVTTVQSMAHENTKVKASSRYRFLSIPRATLFDRKTQVKWDNKTADI